MIVELLILALIIICTYSGFVTGFLVSESKTRKTVLGFISSSSGTVSADILTKQKDYKLNFELEQPEPTEKCCSLNAPECCKKLNVIEKIENN